MAEAILRNLSSWGSLSVLSLSLSAKNCPFFFLGGVSVTMARLILPEAAHLNKKSQNLPGWVAWPLRSAASTNNTIEHVQFSRPFVQIADFSSKLNCVGKHKRVYRYQSDG